MSIKSAIEAWISRKLGELVFPTCSRCGMTDGACCCPRNRLDGRRIPPSNALTGGK